MICCDWFYIPSPRSGVCYIDTKRVLISVLRNSCQAECGKYKVSEQSLCFTSLKIISGKWFMTTKASKIIIVAGFVQTEMGERLSCITQIKHCHFDLDLIVFICTSIFRVWSYSVSVKLM